MAVAVLLLAACQPASNAVPTQAVVDVSTQAPVVVSPADGSFFDSSAVTLRWDWPPGLGPGQFFAVRVWYADQRPIETWTRETSFSAQKSIDSFSRAQGDFHWQVVAINTSAEKGFESLASQWSATQTLHRVPRVIPTPYPVEEQSSLAKYVLAQNLPSKSAIIDFVRSFVHANTNQSHEEPGRPNRSDTIARLYAYSQGQQAEKVFLECDGMSTVMLTLFTEIGLESRLIFLYRDGGDKINEHTTLEVYNPDTNRWEITDPTYDVFLVDTTTGERVNTERIAFGPTATIAACRAGGCDDSATKRLVPYFQAYRIGYSSTFYVNPDRFDVSKRFAVNQNRNLAEYLTGNPLDFVFQFRAEKP